MKINNIKPMSLEKFFSELAEDETDILSRIQWQYAEWFTFAKTKRLELHANFDHYKNLAQEWEVGDETTYSTINALMARSTSEEFRGEFEAGNERDRQIINNLNSVLQQDYDNDDMLAVDIYGNFFRYTMWVYIKIRTGWNGKTKSNEFNYVDPRIWVPDPNWDYSTGKFAYSGFEVFTGEYGLESEWENLDQLKPFDRWFGSASYQKYLDQRTSNLVNPGVNSDNNYYDIYHHYFYVTLKNGEAAKAYMILGNGRSLPLYAEIIESGSKDIEPEFPFSFEYYGFEVNNPYGDNVVNHTAEPQKIKALMRNLRIKKAKAELYPMYFYNDKYIDKNKLSFGFNKFIPISTKADGAVNLDSIITSFKPDSRADNSYTVDQDLERQIERATSIGANSVGTTIEQQDKTATEAGIIQNQSDINIAYREKIDNIGKKQFVRVWLQGYLKNFSDADKKIVMLDTGMGATPVELTRKDFITSAYHRIKVRSRTQAEMQKKKDSMALSQLINLVMSSENYDRYQKILLIKDYAEALWYDKAKIETRLGGSPEEELIKDENTILLTDYIDPNYDDDHVMHMILQKPTRESTLDAIMHYQAHRQMWMQSGKTMNMEWNGTQQAIQASMAASNVAQLNKSQNLPITPQ